MNPAVDQKYVERIRKTCEDAGLQFHDLTMTVVSRRRKNGQHSKNPKETLHRWVVSLDMGESEPWSFQASRNLTDLPSTCRS